MDTTNDQPGAQAAELTLQVVEVLHYAADVDKAIEFYEEKLGWPVIWRSPGNMAMLDAGGVYQLTIVAAKWAPDWAEGGPVPRPQLALESKDLRADIALLESRGLTGLSIGGDPASMLTSAIMDPAGIELFVWQDTTDAPATKVVEEYNAQRKPAPLYSLGECLFFVEDMAAAERFYTETLGFQVHNRHGEVFAGLRRGAGPILGLYHWPRWWEQPVPDAPPAPVRLFLECPDIAAEHQRQNEGGAAPDELRSSNDGLSWFSTADPDGNLMTFWQYTPPS
jgi:catechol 2,3-dioxygenase-like lactoylglutathione lyase family enzyme